MIKSNKPLRIINNVLNLESEIVVILRYDNILKDLTKNIYGISVCDFSKENDVMIPINGTERTISIPFSKVDEKDGIFQEKIKLSILEYYNETTPYNSDNETWVLN